jgi:hypothetical protein
MLVRGRKAGVFAQDTEASAGSRAANDAADFLASLLLRASCHSVVAALAPRSDTGSVFPFFFALFSPFGVFSFWGWFGRQETLSV